LQQLGRYMHACIYGNIGRMYFFIHPHMHDMQFFIEKR
jgi:hypothetical protein